MPQLSPHDWLRPKLGALVAEAEAAGIERSISVAVITDLINEPPFSTGAPENNEQWNQDIGEPDYMVNQDAPLSDEPVGKAAPNGFGRGSHFHRSGRRA
jgi:hypothetical protein